MNDLGATFPLIHFGHVIPVPAFPRRTKLRSCRLSRPFRSRASSIVALTLRNSLLTSSSPSIAISRSKALFFSPSSLFCRAHSAAADDSPPELPNFLFSNFGKRHEEGLKEPLVDVLLDLLEDR